MKAPTHAFLGAPDACLFGAPIGGIFQPNVLRGRTLTEGTLFRKKLNIKD